MTTFTIEGYSFRNSVPSSGSNDFGITKLRLSGSADLGVSYTILEDDPNAFPTVSFGVSQGTLDHATRDGVLIGAPTSQVIGQFDWTEGGAARSSIILILSFEGATSAELEFYFIGGDPAPEINSEDDFNAWALTITGQSDVTSGPFAPNTNIPVSSVNDVEISNGITFVGLATGEIINGTPDDDVLLGEGGNDTINGLGGDDIIEGGAGSDMLDGGAGIDTLSYAGSNAGVAVNFIAGTAGGGHAAGDSITGFENLTGSEFGDILTGSVGVNTINGLGGNDLINGSSAADTINGGMGNDTLIGAAGADVINGGIGLDTASYFNSNGAVQIDLGSGTATGAHAAGDTLSRIENVLGSQFNDTLTGDTGANVLTGGAGVDTLDGGDGDDSLIGQGGDDILISSLGADLMNGGAGSDLVDYSGSNAVIDARIGRVSNVGGHAEGDNLYGVENITGSVFNDTIVGSNLVNILNGGTGSDTMNGAQGADTLIGGQGNDVLIGGSGADMLDGGVSVDTANYFSSNNGVIVNLETGTGQLGHASGDTLVDIENVAGSNGGNDQLIGNFESNFLQGFAGADRLKGGTGGDLLSGGNDTDQDRFIYDANGFGNDVITDFGDGGGNEDILDMRGLSLSFADVNAMQSGAATVLTFDGVTGQITLNNTTATDLDAGDFFF